MPSKVFLAGLLLGLLAVLPLFSQDNLPAQTSADAKLTVTVLESPMRGDTLMQDLGGKKWGRKFRWPCPEIFSLILINGKEAEDTLQKLSALVKKLGKKPPVDKLNSQIKG